MSPSRYVMYYFSGANRRANAYFAKLNEKAPTAACAILLVRLPAEMDSPAKDYRTKLIQYRVELRICSRLEWYILHRELRMKRREGADDG